MDVFSEIGVFTRVVDARSFTRAGQQLGLTPSGVSRVVARLEERLGVRLLNRTTRSISLTDDGAAYYERCQKILAELEDANLAMARARSAPRGRLRVDAPLVLGDFMLGPAVPSFLEAYPDVSLDLSLRDHLIDPIAEGVDVVVRMAELRESELVSKRLGSVRLVVAGAPSYFARRGRPREVADLEKHACIGYLSGGTAMPWRFSGRTGPVSVTSVGRLHVNCGQTLRQAARAGLGLIQVFEYFVADDLRSGALELVLCDHEPEPRPIYALYPHHKHAVPKVRVFLDFVASIFRSGAPGDGKAAARANGAGKHDGRSGSGSRGRSSGRARSSRVRTA
ncbi:LysR family transcriptional regulator [Sorangium sp. So ce131]|uniref:LysR family transcriptional regulator n=1 Tax=Sorangium sp. So ce131 TaxID=3133282 RepID=UPI003F5E198B